MAPRAWLSVLTVLSPAAEAATSLGGPGQDREHCRLGRPVGSGDNGVYRHQDQKWRQRGSTGGQGGARGHDRSPSGGDAGQQSSARVPLDIGDAEEAADGRKEESETNQSHRDRAMQSEGVDCERRDVTPFGHGHAGKGQYQPGERPIVEQDQDWFDEASDPSRPPRSALGPGHGRKHTGAEAAVALGTDPWARTRSSVDDHEDALPGALFGRLGHRVFELRRDRGHLSFPSRLVEDGVALLHVGQAIVAEDEDRGTDLSAESVPRAQLLVDPDPHERFTILRALSASNSRTNLIFALSHLPSQGPIGPTVCDRRSLAAGAASPALRLSSPRYGRLIVTGGENRRRSEDGGFDSRRDG